jgi:HrpA-like RNA helicase
VSAAAARQRRGRAGRVRAGVCFKLYSTTTAEAFAAHDEPEIARVPLESTILQIMAMGSPDPVALLSEALQPPSPQSVEATVDALVALSAIEPDPSRQKLSFKYRLTPLGTHMSRLPCDVREHPPHFKPILSRNFSGPHCQAAAAGHNFPMHPSCTRYICMLVPPHALCRPV